MLLLNTVRLSFVGLLLLLLAPFILTGCLSDEGEADEPSNIMSEAPLVISGNVVKGPLAFAGVKLYVIDTQVEAYFDNSAPLFSTSTDAWAKYSEIDLYPQDKNVYVLEVDGTDATDLDTNETPVIPYLYSLVFPDQMKDGSQVNVTPLTTLTFYLAKEIAGPSATASAVLMAWQRAKLILNSTLLFGITGDRDLYTVDILPGAGSDDPSRLSDLLLHRTAVEYLSALIYELSESQNVTPNEMLQSLARDLAIDGVINGRQSDKGGAYVALDSFARQPGDFMVPKTLFKVSEIAGLLEYERQIIDPTGQPIDESLRSDIYAPSLHSDIDGDGLLNAVDALPYDNMQPQQAIKAFPDKFNPGDYMLVSMEGATPSSHEFIYDKPYLLGIQKRYTWRSLEPIEGKYDFSEVEADLYTLSAADKRLVIQIQDKSFFDQGVYVPDYILSNDIYQGGVAANNSGGWTTKKWNIAVQERLKALYHALGARFDREVLIEAVTLPETVGSLTCFSQFECDYDVFAYAKGLSWLAVEAKKAFPTTVVIQYINGLDGQISMLPEIADELVNNGVGLGGPDIVSGSEWHEENSYPLIRQSVGQVPMGMAVQWDNYERTSATGTQSVSDILRDYAYDNLHLNYVFWLKREPYFSSQVMPTLSAQ